MLAHIIIVLMALFAITVTSTRALASEESQILNYYKEIFSNTNPALKNFSIEVEDFKVLVNGSKTYNYGTQMISRVETNSINDLENFGLAQIMRGCVYSSSIQNGQIVNTFDYDIENYGQIKTFRFQDWVINGFIPDPLDWGDQPNLKSRQNFYMWNTVPGSTDHATSKYVIQGTPTNPALYVQDIPGTAFMDDHTGRAKNISLQFETCLYNSKDVSRNVPEIQIHFAKPIHCFNWAASWIYDFKKQEYISLPDISPVCL